MLIIDALQYVNWTRELFTEARDGGVNAIHVTISYWENTKDTLENIGDWRKRFRDHSDLIIPVLRASDINKAKAENKVGIILGFQNCSPIEDDLRLVETMYNEGARIMQLTYNNQSLLATGCYEEGDSGVTRFGREVIKEMNRVGMIIDMSHSAEHSTLQTIELSERPIAITHANPSNWHHALRNKSDDVLKALGQSGGMLGFSMYPFHLNNGPDCTLDDFCGMIMDTAELMGIDHIGIGSDLCQNWGYETLEWMRSGKWTFKPDYGEGSAQNADWPRQPDWFGSSKDFGNIAAGLKDKGMNDGDIARVMGLNWYRFFEIGFVGK
ncbi:MAG: membrane dipeptidase [Hellea sp.]|nr:membrane dipeptidase [Hellea sp.]